MIVYFSSKSNIFLKGHIYSLLALQLPVPQMIIIQKYPLTFIGVFSLNCKNGSLTFHVCCIVIKCFMIIGLINHHFIFFSFCCALHSKKPSD